MDDLELNDIKAKTLYEATEETNCGNPIQAEDLNSQLSPLNATNSPSSNSSKLYENFHIGEPNNSSPTSKAVISITESQVDTPDHLFWVPAYLHPELHPCKFKTCNPNIPHNSHSHNLRREKSYIDCHIVITRDTNKHVIQPRASSPFETDNNTVNRNQTNNANHLIDVFKRITLPTLKRTQNIQKRASTSTWMERQSRKQNTTWKELGLHSEGTRERGRESPEPGNELVLTTSNDKPDSHRRILSSSEGREIPITESTPNNAVEVAPYKQKFLLRHRWSEPWLILMRLVSPTHSNIHPLPLNKAGNSDSAQTLHPSSTPNTASTELSLPFSPIHNLRFTALGIAKQSVDKNIVDIQEFGNHQTKRDVPPQFSVVEESIYGVSHCKLAQPRPLSQQVLISNLMLDIVKTNGGGCMPGQQLIMKSSLIRDLWKVDKKSNRRSRKKARSVFSSALIGASSYNVRTTSLPSPLMLGHDSIETSRNGIPFLSPHLGPSSSFGTLSASAFSTNAKKIGSVRSDIQHLSAIKDVTTRTQIKPMSYLNKNVQKKRILDLKEALGDRVCPL